MTIFRHHAQAILTVKYSLVAALLASVVACGGETPSDYTSYSIHHESDPDRLGEGKLPTSLQETLAISGNQQLFPIQQSGSSSTSSTNDNASVRSHSESGAGANALLILDEKGVAKRYLADAKFDQFHVVKNGTELAYIARISQSDYDRLKIQDGGGWVILKNGQKPILIKGPGLYKPIRDPSDFIGQTETSGGLVFSYGTYVDLDGKELPYGKRINDVSQALYVSGDYVGLHRKINGKKVTTLVNVKPKSSGDPRSGFRRNYDDYFTPDYVQITNDGRGLMSDIRSSSSIANESHITRLEDEFEESRANSGERATALARADLKDSVWFNASIRLPQQDVALATCYVHAAMGYQLMRITLDPITGTGKAKWKFEKLFDVAHSAALSTVKRARPFVQGKDFTLVKNGAELLYINHTDKTAAGHKKISLTVANAFEIRPSNDLTQFFVLGERLSGDQVMAIYDGSTGNLVSTEEIDIQ